MKKVKAIAFDLGNVLVRIHPERFLTSLGIVERDRQLSLRDAIVETVRTYERGGLATYDCLQKLGEILEYEFDQDAIRRAFANAQRSGGPKGTSRWAHSFRRTSILTNRNVGTRAPRRR